MRMLFCVIAEAHSDPTFLRVLGEVMLVICDLAALESIHLMIV